MRINMEAEGRFIATQLQRICDGEPWYGDSVFKILEGVTAEQASQRAGKAHTIWEIVRHTAGWAAVDARRLNGEYVREPEAGDWPPVSSSEAEWQHDLKLLRQSIQDLSTAAGKLGDDDLERILARGSSTYREQMHGALQHVVYHSAQMGILKKSL